MPLGGGLRLELLVVVTVIASDQLWGARVLVVAVAAIVHLDSGSGRVERRGVGVDAGRLK